MCDGLSLPRFDRRRNAVRLRHGQTGFGYLGLNKEERFLTFLTTHGFVSNPYSQELVQAGMTTQCLFNDVL